MVWIPKHGMGHYPVSAADEPYYDGADALEYWEEYRRRDASPTGTTLTDARVAFVLRHAPMDAVLVDLGIGGGKFLRTWTRRGGTGYGVDVNPHGKRWLRDNDLAYPSADPPIVILTMWDVLEHLQTPDSWLGRARAWVFCSIPVYASCSEILGSKHFKPSEHRWYWTPTGLIGWMAAKGFDLAEMHREEEALGREGVASFAFKRRAS